MNDHWTTEEYREYCRTGRIPTNGNGVVIPKVAKGTWKSPAAVERPGDNIGDVGGQKVRKYRNEPVTIDGKRFDSKHEAAVYQELALRVKAGELQCVCRQVPFDLPGGVKYIADFVAFKPGWQLEGVYDAKSPATKKDKTYVIKRKLMKSEWGIDIIEV